MLAGKEGPHEVLASRAEVHPEAIERFVIVNYDRAKTTLAIAVHQINIKKAVRGQKRHLHFVQQP